MGTKVPLRDSSHLGAQLPHLNDKASKLKPGGPGASQRPPGPKEHDGRAPPQALQGSGVHQAPLNTCFCLVRGKGTRTCARTSEQPQSVRL